MPRLNKCQPVPEIDFVNSEGQTLCVPPKDNSGYVTYSFLYYTNCQHRWRCRISIGNHWCYFLDIMLRMVDNMNVLFYKGQSKNNRSFGLCVLFCNDSFSWSTMSWSPMIVIMTNDNQCLVSSLMAFPVIFIPQPQLIYYRLRITNLQYLRKGSNRWNSTCDIKSLSSPSLCL